MTGNSLETPRQMLNRKVEEYQSRLGLLKTIAESAQKTESGYLISPKLLAEVKRLSVV